MHSNLSGAVSNAFPLFSNLEVRDLFDILIVALLLYVVFLILKRAHSSFIFSGLAVLLGFYVIARLFNFYLTIILFQSFFTFFVVIIVVIFQRELRNFFEWFSLRRRFSRRRKETLSDVVSEHIIRAAETLAQKKIGALIVLPGEISPEPFLEGGIRLDGQISVPLILSIFDPSSPGHDGAVVVEGNRVKKFAVHLPLAEKFQKFGNLGTRHRAALGLAERSDAMVLAVSEERGIISVARDGELRPVRDSGELKLEMSAFLRERFFRDVKAPWYSFVTQNFREKFMALVLALILWFIFVLQFGSGFVSRQFNIPVEYRLVPEESVIDTSSVQMVSLILQGRNQDFNLIDPADLRVSIDVSDLGEGWHKINIDSAFIKYPASLSVVNFSPKTITFHLKNIQEQK